MRIETFDAAGLGAEKGLFATEGTKIVTEDRKNNIDDETKIVSSVQYDKAGYDKGSFAGATSGEDIKNALASESAKNSMETMAKTMGVETVDELEEEGSSALDADEKKIVTVVDKIQMSMAIAGLDITKCGGNYSADDIEAITGSSYMAADVAKAIAKAGEIADAGELTDGDMKYLLDNELEPTIDNVYAAKFSGSQSYVNQSAAVDFESVKDSVVSVIKAAGLQVNDTTMEEGKWLLDNGAAVTPENLLTLDALKNNELFASQEETAGAIVNSLAEGKSAGEAYLVPGFSAIERAVDAKNIIDNVTDEQLFAAVEDGEITINSLKAAGAKAEGNGADGEASDKNADAEPADAEQTLEQVRARRTLEETRLTMSIQANFSLIKRGMSIETTELTELVDALKQQEQNLYSGLSEDGLEVSEESVLIYENTNTALAELRSVPAVVLGQVDLKINTLQETRNIGWNLKDSFERAGETYEALGTSPRADFGDSLKKAFGNVSDILSDIGLSDTASNQRAVRILGYNQMEITATSVLEIRDADETMQSAFKSLTPSVVTEMVKTGVNPLDMSMEELVNKAEEIRDNLGIENETEKFSKFLVKMEQNHEINEEERSAYIGIYRLISRVEASDGAALGSLLDQDRDVTMRNLMTALRTEKKKGMELSVDDEAGSVEVIRSQMTITEQIEENIIKNQMRQISELLSPAVLAQQGVEETLDMTPEELLSRLEAAQGTEVFENEQKDYATAQLDEFGEAAASEQQVYDILSQMDIPCSATNLQAVSAMMTNKNSVFSRLLAETEKEDTPDIRALMDKAVIDFGEASKTPGEMAEAQEALAELAEHAMEGYVYEEEVSSVDIKGMKLVHTVANVMNKMARQETYHLPIKVNDANGNVSLKIVNGSTESGLMKMIFSCMETGEIGGSFRYTKEGVEGELTAEDDDIRNALEERLGELTSQVEASTGVSVSISIKAGYVSESSLYEGAGAANAANTEDTAASGSGDADETGVSTSEIYSLSTKVLGFLKSFAESL